MRQDDRRAGQDSEGRAENELWIYGGSVDAATGYLIITKDAVGPVEGQHVETLAE